MKITSKQLDSLLEEWLEDHRRKRNSGTTDGDHGDLMDVMLSNLEGMDLAGYDADTVNKATCMVMYNSHFSLAYKYHFNKVKI